LFDEPNGEIITANPASKNNPTQAITHINFLLPNNHLLSETLIGTAFELSAYCGLLFNSVSKI
jgi:hypothetical protein